MTLSELITQLVDARITLALENDGLSVNAPKGALTPEIMTSLKMYKEDLIKHLKASSKHSQKIIVADRKQNIHVSFSQQRLWLLDQIDGASAHYNMPIALKLSGTLNVNALAEAFTTILERHESLRTCFIADDDGQPLQIIQAPIPFVVPFLNLSDLEENERQLQLAKYIAEEAHRIFDLTRDLMLRVQLIKTAADEHIVLVTMHHIASDGWSMAILINEFSALYSAYVQGKKNPLSPLGIQYADYAHWQRNWLQGEVLDQQLDYWAKQLVNLPVVHSLPLDHLRPAIQSFGGNNYYSKIDATHSNLLNDLCQLQGATLFMGLHAAFSVLLARYSNETDIVVGTSIANREQTEVTNLIGFFVNTLVLRSDLSESPNLIQLINRSKNMLLDAYAHQQVPFEKIVERLQPERSLSHSPLFQVMLILQNNEQGTLELPGIILSPVEQGGADVAKYELTLNVSESEQGLSLEWEYNTDLFEQDTIARMANHFELLLKALIATPNENVFSVGMLGEQERQTLLINWNNTQTDHPTDKCIHELFEAQVENNPQAIAVIFENQQLTYEQLNQQANQLAHYLVSEKSVKPDTLVGICVERSLEMLIGILAILKAGGAYVPLDPEYPEARLKYMLDDAKLTTILTQRHLRETTPVNDVQAVYLDDEKLQQLLQTYPIHNPDLNLLGESGLTSNHLAYVIYTSGSTGNPKGVMVQHNNVVNFLVTMQEKPGITARDSLLAVTSTSFDIHGLELFLTLIVGAKLVIASKPATSDPQLLIALMEKHSISLMQATPATWKMLLDAQWQPVMPTKVLCGGEALSLNVATALLALQNIELWNMYGPTETTIWSTTGQVFPADNQVLMGHPIGNTQIYVCSNELALVPAGVAGELLIGGAGVTRGYLNRPELTAEKFIANPFYDSNNPASSARLYKTGDLVRWLTNGTVEFLGRIDNQVKIRGFRIELGEIENTLSSHAKVNDAIVVAKELVAGDKQIVAYVVTDAIDVKDEAELSINARFNFIENLRHHLGQTLPDYMVPSAFVLLKQLPLTPNGKIDRKALQELDVALQKNTYVAPRTEAEKILCDIWQEVLGVERVGITDNFFQLGGDSLKVMRFIAGAKKENLFYYARQLFENSTIDSLIKSSGNNLSQLISQSLVVGQVPLSSAQQWFLDAMLVSTNRGTISILSEANDFDVEVFKQSLWEVLKHHDALRAKFIKNSGEWLQILVSPEEINVPIEIRDISNLTLNEQIKFIDAFNIKKIQEGVDLSHAPLIRVDVFNIGKINEFIIRFEIHHLLVDAYSLSVIQEDLMQCYLALSTDNNYIFPQKTISMADWQNTLYGYVSSSNEMKKEFEYWQYLPWDKIKPISTDHPSQIGEYNLDSFAEFEHRLTREQTHNLLHTASNLLKIPVIDILIAALAQSFLSYHGNIHQLFKVVDSGRDLGLDVDLSRTVGWIAISRILLLTIDTDTPSSISAIHMIHNQIKNMPNKGLGFELLKHYHSDEPIKEKINALPKPEILINYLGVSKGDDNQSVFMNAYEAKETKISQFDPRNTTHEKFVCTILIHNDELIVRWQYNKNLFKTETIHGLTNLMFRYLNVEQRMNAMDNPASVKVEAQIL